MKNYLLIQLTQRFPTWVARQIHQFKTRKAATTSSPKSDGAQVGINHFEPEAPKSRRALVTLTPHAWKTALNEHPNIKLYNHSGFVYSLVQALNEAGYLVDLVDTREDFTISRHYDLFVGHGGGCRQIMEQLPEGIPIYQYISGLYWKVFEEESDARYDRFFETHGGKKPELHRRDIKHLIDGLELLNEKADVLFTINCPRMIAAYAKHVHKFHFTGLGAYIDPLFKIGIEEKNFDEGRKNFLYVGGTGGNLQKGIDLLIEAFADMPDLNLYIYCKVEEELIEHCRHLLAKPNIHYIYHWRYSPYHEKITDLMKRCNFSVHAPINIGMGTAFMATLGVGLIPVGYVDVSDPDEDSVLTDSWQVEDLKVAVREAAEKSSDWCEEASIRSSKRYATYCEPRQVKDNFRSMFESVPAHPGKSSS